MVLYMLKKRGLKWRHHKNMETYKKVAPQTHVYQLIPNIANLYKHAKCLHNVSTFDENVSTFNKKTETSILDL